MRLKHLPIAALAALSLVAGTVAAPTVADAQNRDRQIRGDRDGDRTVRVNRDRNRQVTNRHVTNRHVTTRHVTTRHVYRHHPHNRFVVRSTAISVPYVVLGAPVVYRAYGAGWCRALHRGRHWSPGIGWHAGQHVGRVRC